MQHTSCIKQSISIYMASIVLLTLLSHTHYYLGRKTTIFASIAYKQATSMQDAVYSISISRAGQYRSSHKHTMRDCWDSAWALTREGMPVPFITRGCHVQSVPLIHLKGKWLPHEQCVDYSAVAGSCHPPAGSSVLFAILPGPQGAQGGGSGLPLRSEALAARVG